MGEKSFGERICMRGFLGGGGAEVGTQIVGRKVNLAEGKSPLPYLTLHYLCH